MTFTGSPGVEPATDYDRFVDWEKRLGREGPFFERMFAEHGVRRVIDAGCGTGRHDVRFASWGLDVVGVDPDPSMLAQARINAEAAGADVRFVEGGFGRLGDLGLGPADAVLCLGNALPHVSGMAGLREALGDFATVLRPGGILVLHLLNHQRLIEARVRSMSPVVRDDEQGTSVFLRVMDYVEGGIRFDFVTLERPAGGWEKDEPWEVTSRRSLHAALPEPLLREALQAAGLSHAVAYGDHSGKPFDPRSDESLILVATRE